MNANHAAPKIIVAHEDLPTGIRAVALLNKLSARLENYGGEGDRTWRMENHDVWNFKCLQDLALREQALAASIDADIIVIAAGSQSQLPSWVKDWIENALGQKQGIPAAMVAIFCGRQESPAYSLPPIAYLRQLAELHGMDFFCNLDNQTSPGDSSIEVFFNPRFETDTEHSHDALAYEFETQRWGINE